MFCKNVLESVLNDQERTLFDRFVKNNLNAVSIVCKHVAGNTMEVIISTK